MGQLMLINPKKRRKTRTAAQKRATAKMVSANRSRRRTKPRLASNPAPVRRRRRTTSVAAVKRRSSRRIRRNPIGFSGITGSLMNAGIGAVGAIAVDTAFSFLPIPLDFKVGYKGAAAKAALALGVGIFGGKIIGKDTAGKLAAGSLTVIAYDLVKGLMPVTVPTTVGYVGSGMYSGDLPNMGEYVPGGDFGFDSSNAGMGEYINGYN